MSNSGLVFNVPEEVIRALKQKSLEVNHAPPKGQLDQLVGHASGSSHIHPRTRTQSDQIEMGDNGEGQWKIVPPRRRVKTVTHMGPRVTLPAKSNGKADVQGKETTLKVGNGGSLAVCTNAKQNSHDSKLEMSTIGQRLKSEMAFQRNTSQSAAKQGSMRSSPVVQPTWMHVQGQVQKLTLSTPQTDPSNQGKLQEPSSSKALVLVKEAVNRASKKRVLEEDASHTLEESDVADLHPLGPSSRALALFQRSSPTNEKQGESQARYFSVQTN
ncbi:hypothetical protein QJS10_CPB22g00882 [Acorus calamus]|uniref:Uncharacterized protein n=1 Tax=Acorus calamus TaxID=4465 RepID=A0AAV9C1D5_ACOCL|nr:hypothetical protein QJS10_CPB22g00882 [Acorus calamus]